MALVLWSGGCDSTLLLHDLLCQWDGNLTLDDVRTLSVRHPQVPAADESKRARDSAAAVLEKRFRAFERTELTLSYGEHQLGLQTNVGCDQACVWLLQAALHLRTSEDLYVGYIRGDDVWHYRYKLVEAFDTLQWLGHRTGRLVFPLEWVTKAEVIGRLKKAGLYRSAWYCEDPKKGRKCGTCTPCKTHATALWRIEKGMR